MAFSGNIDCTTEERGKVCVSCERSLPLTAFYTQRSAKDGRTSYCVICSRAAAARWKEENPEKYAAKQARGRASQSPSYPAYRAAWQKANPGRHLEANRQYRDRMMLKDKPPETGVKVCKNCGVERPLSHYLVRRASPDGRHTTCVICTKTRSREYKYGLKAERFEQMWRDQEGACVLCHDLLVPTERHGVVVDHNHTTGAVRGLLCSHCNIALGNFRDNADACERAAAYLRRHAGAA